MENVLEGYSVTIFAYGQTGGGKSYTITGREDTVNDKILGNNEYIGLKPRSIRFLWSLMSKRSEKFYIKVNIYFFLYVINL